VYSRARGWRWPAGRRQGDVADTLTSTLWATPGPDALHEAVAMAHELRHVASELGDPRLEATARGRLFHHLLEVGDTDAAERGLVTLERLAEARRERYFKWTLAVLQANHAYSRGRLEDFETLAHEALRHRYEGQDECRSDLRRADARATHGAGTIRRTGGTVESLAAQYPQNVVWRFALADATALTRLSARTLYGPYPRADARAPSGSRWETPSQPDEALDTKPKGTTVYLWPGDTDPSTGPSRCWATGRPAIGRGSAVALGEAGDVDRR
jgi:hypothetical protein